MSDLTGRQNDLIGRKYRRTSYGDATQSFTIVDESSHGGSLWVQYDDGFKTHLFRRELHGCTEVVDVPEKGSLWRDEDIIGSLAHVRVLLADTEHVAIQDAEKKGRLLFEWSCLNTTVIPLHIFHQHYEKADQQ